jgi:hypothetical protein
MPDHMRLKWQWMALTEIGGTPLEHPPYSSDLAPCDFWAFPTTKRELRGKKPVPLSSWSLRQTVCSTFSRSGWSVVRSESLAKGGTSKKRPSPHLHKFPSRINEVNPRTFQTAFVYFFACSLRYDLIQPEMVRRFLDSRSLSEVADCNISCYWILCSDCVEVLREENCISFRIKLPEARNFPSWLYKNSVPCLLTRSGRCPCYRQRKSWKNLNYFLLNAYICIYRLLEMIN